MYTCKNVYCRGIVMLKKELVKENFNLYNEVFLRHLN